MGRKIEKMFGLLCYRSAIKLDMGFRCFRWWDAEQKLALCFFLRGAKWLMKAYGGWPLYSFLCILGRKHFWVFWNRTYLGGYSKKGLRQ